MGSEDKRLTMKRPNLQEQLFASSEIAEMFDINLSALSNYKKRHQDFPKPAYSLPSGKGMLYWRDEIIEWAGKHFGDLSAVADQMEARANRMQDRARILRTLKKD